MAIELARRCGYRRVGATYLVADVGHPFACGRLPIPLHACPLCEQRPNFSRNLQRVLAKNLMHSAPDCKETMRYKEGEGGPARCDVCPFYKLFEQEQAGLMWVGAKFYPGPEDFIKEAYEQGPCKRIPVRAPKWFQLGMWVFLAHEKAIMLPCRDCEGTGQVATPMDPQLGMNCPECDGAGTVHVPAIFYAFKPTRIERIIDKSMEPIEREKLIKDGYTPVELDKDDPDHAPQKKEDDE